MTKNNFQHSVRTKINDVAPVIGSAFNQILNQEFKFDVSFSEQAEINDLLAGSSYPQIAVAFKSGSGVKNIQHVLLIEPDFLLRFYAWMLMDEPAEEISEDHFDALKEGIQQIFGQVKMAVADENGYFNFTDLNTIPAESFENLSDLVLEGEGLHCTYQLTSENNSDTINHYMWAEQPEQFNSHSEAHLAKTMENEPISEGKPVDIQSAEFGNLSYSGDTPGDSRNVNMLLDVELEIRVEIDRKSILVSDLLKLGKGSIVELEKSAGEPLDVYVNGRKFAEGEVVVVDDRFGIRITQLLSPKDRVKSLGQAF